MNKDKINKTVFNRVKNHLLKQKKRSMGDTGCAYRGENGRRCAIGCLISNKEYKPYFEGTAVVSGDYAWDSAEAGLINLMKKKFHGVSIEMLRDLQDVHDAAKPSLWPRELNVVAAKYGIIPPKQ